MKRKDGHAVVFGGRLAMLIWWLAALNVGSVGLAAEASGVTTTRAAGATTQPSAADEALIRKLLRDATGRGEGSAMERVLEGMRASRIKLSVYFDPGGETQKIQRGIVRDLDEALKEAWSSQRPQPTTSRSGSESRRRRSASRPASEQNQQAQPKSSEPMADERATHGTPVAASRPTGGAIRELRRGWGRLPARDRDEVVQGFGQDFLTKYREWIERYYRALANPQ